MLGPFRTSRPGTHLHRSPALFHPSISAACEILDKPTSKPLPHDSLLIALFFEMEYGSSIPPHFLRQSLSVLYGDHLKASSDPCSPWSASGPFLYSNGFLQQKLDPDGWRQEGSPVTTFYCSRRARSPPREAASQLLVSIELARRSLPRESLSCYPSARVKLYLSTATSRKHTPKSIAKSPTKLYGGDDRETNPPRNSRRHRRPARPQGPGLDATVYHMEQGHSRLLTMEHMSIS